ncbi:oxidoreductase [Companilactobacillus sp. RD055328]|uniref:SDR family oxidoreductase n=1 Tax=Companilactobacillus sp. RD055328 TaxID=2916634 RepID=UPI001FC88A6B|nr:SDR family oxidoreductase [Companilactobacillus sp. RD055328]GKQ43192.1 oxidoreductase [Companilactobacillus sp. RD055328]
MKNTFIVGANGAVGRLLVAQMKEKNMSFTAGVRKQEQVDTLQTDGINAKLIDLTGSVDDLVKAFSGADSIIFSAGSGGKTGDDMTLEIDLDGAVKTMEAAQIAGVKRYVMVSSIYADKRETVDASPIRPYMIAKFYADRELRRSTLDYTILHPGYLTNDEPTGKILVDDTSDNIKISRSDVAASLIHLLNNDKSIRKDYTIVNGDKPIETAF